MGEEKPQTLISLIWGLLNVSFLPEAEDLYLRKHKDTLTNPRKIPNHCFCAFQQLEDNAFEGIPETMGAEKKNYGFAGFTNPKTRVCVKNLDPPWNAKKPGNPDFRVTQLQIPGFFPVQPYDNRRVLSACPPTTTTLPHSLPPTKNNRPPASLLFLGSAWNTNNWEFEISTSGHALLIFHCCSRTASKCQYGASIFYGFWSGGDPNQEKNTICLYLSTNSGLTHGARNVLEKHVIVLRICFFAYNIWIRTLCMDFPLYCTMVDCASRVSENNLHPSSSRMPRIAHNYQAVT